MTNLPVQAITADLLKAIVNHNCILSAPPGAGKSSYLPLQLLTLKYFENKQILLLQPRQVAVRSVANYLAEQLNQKVGKTVGYQMRGESVISDETRLCVITEGLLIAKLQADPELSSVGLIIFDEFHERSLQSDLALGLSIEVQSALREDLRLLIMSATLDTKQVSNLLPEAVCLSSQGRSFPIEYFYRPQLSKQKHALALIGHIQNIITEAMQEHSGNILVFLPGSQQIKRLAATLHSLNLANTIISPLFGALTATQQQQAIREPAVGVRKIVLATNIAETSLTIDGVNIVIDSGQEKVQRLHLARKANQLSQQMISKASAVQRAGRAGRQQAGVCYRLWSEQQQQFLDETSAAQISQVDISQALLCLREWGSDFSTLPLIDRPSDAQVKYANGVLHSLGFINKQDKLTSLGKQASLFNTEPRLACILAHALPLNVNNSHKWLSAVVVSLIENQRFQRDANQVDIALLIQELIDNEIQKQAISSKGFRKPLDTSKTAYIKQPAYAELNKQIKRWYQRLQGTRHIAFDNLASDMASLLPTILLQAFPDKLGQQRSNQTYILHDGTGLEFGHYYEGPKPTCLLCLQIQIGDRANGIIQQYCEVPNSVMDEYISAHASNERLQTWDQKLAKVICKEIRSLGAIILQSKVCQLSVNEQTHALIFKQIRERGIAQCFNGSRTSSKVHELIARVQLAKKVDAINACDLPDLSNLQLEASLESWLTPYIQQVSSWQGLLALDWLTIIKSMLNYQQQRYLDKAFPTHFVAPTGNKHPLKYTLNQAVELAVRIQELYGLQDNPKLGQSGEAITLSLLSPAHREIQKTADLSGFWQGSYKEVQKDMKGRYPKHFWPDDPSTAKPTTKTKQKM